MIQSLRYSHMGKAEEGGKNRVGTRKGERQVGSGRGWGKECRGRRKEEGRMLGEGGRGV